jgi:hypothetical protein
MELCYPDHVVEPVQLNIIKKKRGLNGGLAGH